MKLLFLSRFKIERMNQRHFWTVVALFATILGIPSVGRAQTTKQTVSASTDIAGDVMKVGEYQSSAENLARDAATITEIRTSIQAGRSAATLYVHSSPVLTFVGQQPVATEDTKVGVVGKTGASPTNIATIGTSTDISNQTNLSSSDPVVRATVVAAKINQLYRDKVDASKIIVSRFAVGTSTNANPKIPTQRTRGDRYIIKVNDRELVEINNDTKLPQTTNDPASDALQAANNLRRLMGNASPLKEIANLPLRLPVSLPKLPQEISIGPIKLAFKGVASWYGYDGSGNQTAAGERYNPEGMTAAHRSLPLGTKVRVTNTHNGRSVVVRINDRGPYVRGRIIDLSAAAARILGMMGSGVAPVRIEVLGR